MFSVWPHVHPFAVISLLLDHLHVSLGLPLFLFPAGVHLSATLGMESGCIRQMWHIHLHLRFLISSEIGMVVVLRYRSLFHFFVLRVFLSIYPYNLMVTTACDVPVFYFYKLTWFLYKMVFVSLNSHTMGTTSGAGTTDTFRTPGFWRISRNLYFSV